MELIRKIKDTILNTRFENHVFLAGGYVRDLILGVENKDYDFCVDLPDGGIELASFLTKELNGTNVVIFQRFGTTQIVIDEKDLEFVMTRKESYTKDSRNPDVMFGTIEEDVKSKVIKTTSSPELIFEEDPLRILRAIRFACRLGFEIEEETYRCMKVFSEKVSTLSKERIRDEFLKTISKGDFTRALRIYVELRLTKYIGLEELGLTIGMKQNNFHTKDVFGHICDVMDKSEKTPLHRLSALLHDIGKVVTRTVDSEGVVHFYNHEVSSKEITERFMKNLRFSNEETELVCSAVLNHMRIRDGVSDKKLRSIRSELGDDKFSFLLDLCKADRLSHTNSNCRIIERARTLIKVEKHINDSLIVSGDEVMEIFNLKPGKEVGFLLRQVKEMMFENPSISKKEVIESLSKKHI